MYTFTNSIDDMHKEYTGVRDLTMTVDAEASLDEMLDAYYGFLQASGYALPRFGRFEVVESDTVSDE